MSAPALNNLVYYLHDYDGQKEVDSGIQLNEHFFRD